MAISPQYANSTNQLAALKELYTDDKDYMKNIVYAKNPWLARFPKMRARMALPVSTFQFLWNMVTRKDVRIIRERPESADCF